LIDGGGEEASTTLEAIGRMPDCLKLSDGQKRPGKLKENSWRRSW